MNVLLLLFIVCLTVQFYLCSSYTYRFACDSSNECKTNLACTLGSYSPAETTNNWYVSCESSASLYITDSSSSFCTYSGPGGSMHTLCQDLDCPAGSYPSNIATAYPYKSCSTCLPGYECAGGIYFPVACTGGYFCNYPTKTICPPGSFCPAQSSSPIQCPKSYYCPLTGLSSPISCPINATSFAGSVNITSCCSVGFNCTSGPPLTCLSNYWAENGKCTPCTTCSPGYLTTKPCSKGNNTVCTECQRGSFCPTNFIMVTCPYHTHCPNGSTAPIPCPNGMISRMGAYDPANCTFSRKGWRLTPVTIISNNIIHKPDFKFKGSIIRSNARQLFEFRATAVATDNTKNEITFYGNVSNVEILAVGGGGAGGNAKEAGLLPYNLECAGGGGGAGTLFYTTDFVPMISRSYTVKVGYGGHGVDTVTRQKITTTGMNGGSTEVIFNNTVLIKATGGGGGGDFNGGQGGSGGGSYSSWNGDKDPVATCVGGYVQTKMYVALPEIKTYACKGMSGAFSATYAYSGGGGGAYSVGSGDAGCAARGGSGIISNITGIPTPYAAGGGGHSVGIPSCGGLGGSIWNETYPMIIGGSTPGGDGYPNSGSGGASAGSGTKSGTGANGVFIIAWDPVLSLCPLHQYNDMDDSTLCTRCQPGFFTFTEGASECSKCGQNMFPNITTGLCQACSDTTGTCSSPLLPSKKCRNDGTTVCCGIDTYFIDGVSAECIPCDERSYSIDGSGSECTPCTANSKKSDYTQGYFCECDLAQGLYKHNYTSNTCAFCPENNLCPAQGTAIPCPIGTSRYEGDTRTDTCQPCENTPQIGEYAWLNSSSNRCTFQCNAGYYVDNPMEGMFLCNKCTKENFTCATGQTGPSCDKTKQVCPSGQYTPACELGRTSDNIGCKYCPAVLGAIWTVLCDFTCSTGRFRNTTEMKCNTCSKPICIPGKYATVCGKDSDSVCGECTNGPVTGPYNWTSLTCNFLCTGSTSYFDLLNNSCQECGEGTYRSSPTSCTKCTTTQCIPGMYRTTCGRGEVSDTTCELICNGTSYFNTSTKSCAVCPKDTYRFTLTVCSKCKLDKCIPGRMRTQCLAGATTDTSSCIACTNGAVVGEYDWISECEFVCKYGLYHNKSLNECLSCSIPECIAGKYPSPCTDDEGLSECIACKAPVITGPFNWTTQCSFACTNRTFLGNNSNGTNCIPCTEQCPNGTFIGSQCSATANTKCTNCSIRPLSTTSSTFEWTAGVVCSFKCLDNYVWDGVGCINDTGVIKVSVRRTTMLELNNTVEDICKNIDRLVSAVVDAMQEVYRIPFSGNASAVNNDTVESACSSSGKKNSTILIINRKLLLLIRPAGESSSVTVTATSKEETTYSNANNIQSNTSNGGVPSYDALIQQKLISNNNVQDLKLIASITYTTQESTTPPPPPSVESPPPVLQVGESNYTMPLPTILLCVFGAVVFTGCVVALSFYIVCCHKIPRKVPYQQMENLVTKG